MTPFSLDFEVGGFNPSTLGICIRVPSKLNPTVRAAVAEALFSKQTEMGRKEVFRKAYRRDLDNDTKFTLLSYAAVIEHELRHFHEYLSTPYGQWMMFVSLQLSSVVQPILRDLRNEKSIVVPLQSWASLSDDLFNTIHSLAGYEELKRTPPPITQSSIPHCQKLIGELETLSQPRIGYPGEGREFTATIKQLMEATAVNTQLQALSDIFHDEAIVGQFFEQLRLKDNSLTYTHAFNLWYTIECEIDGGRPARFSKPRIGYGIRNAIIFFCLCATKKEAQPLDQVADLLQAQPDHPSDIFFMLFARMLTSKKVPSFKSVMAWLDEQASNMGLMTLKESLEYSVKVSRSRAAYLRTIHEKIKHGAVFSLKPSTLNAYDDWINGQEFMCNQIIQDPLTFFEPSSYIANLKRWVGAPGFILTDVPFEDGRHFSEALEQQQPAHSKWKFAALSKAPIFGAEVVSIPSMWELAVAAHSGVALFKVNKNEAAYQNLSRAMLKIVGNDWKVWEA
jgi:hypothetical protein